MSETSITVPAPAELRATIRAKTDELRALRQLLRLAEAAVRAQTLRRERQEVHRAPH